MYHFDCFWNVASSSFFTSFTKGACHSPFIYSFLFWHTIYCIGVKRRKEEGNASHNCLTFFIITLSMLIGTHRHSFKQFISKLFIQVAQSSWLSLLALSPLNIYVYLSIACMDPENFSRVGESGDNFVSHWGVGGWVRMDGWVGGSNAYSLAILLCKSDGSFWLSFARTLNKLSLQLTWLNCLLK